MLTPLSLLGSSSSSTQRRLEKENICSTVGKACLKVINECHIKLVETRCRRLGYEEILVRVV